MPAPDPQTLARTPLLTERQRSVLRAVVMAWLGDAAPIGSASIAQLLPVNLSPATIRSTLAELGALGLVKQPHVSAGRVPSERGLEKRIGERMAEIDSKRQKSDTEAQ